jgi:hypothetical protein
MFGSIDGMEQLYKLVGNTFLQYRERKRERERERERVLHRSEQEGVGIALKIRIYNIILQRSARTSPDISNRIHRIHRLRSFLANVT